MEINKTKWFYHLVYKYAWQYPTSGTLYRCAYLYTWQYSHMQKKCYHHVYENTQI